MRLAHLGLASASLTLSLAAVITNTWGIGRDTAIFPDPETFRPSRYLGEERKKIEKLLSKGHTGTFLPGAGWKGHADYSATGFGHARRICRKIRTPNLPSYELELIRSLRSWSPSRRSFALHQHRQHLLGIRHRSRGRRASP